MNGATNITPSATPIPALKKKRIPVQWERFAARIACGDTLVDAMRFAYPARRKSQPATIAVDASRLSKKPEVAELIEKCRREEMRGVLLSRDERLAILGQIAKSKVTKPTDKIGAIREYTKIVGDASPERSEIELKNPIVGAASFVEMSVQQRAEALLKQMEADSPP
jgi:hypothetical protein